MTDEQIGAAIRRASETVSAPAALRERIAEAPARRRRPRVRVPRLALGGALASAVAVTVAVVLLLTGGGPTVTEVASAALQPPTHAAPGAPYRGGWHPVGARQDRVGGRRATTVVYRKNGRGVHYTILGGAPIDEPSGRDVTIDGRRYTLLRDRGTSIATWRQRGHTCVLASRAAGERELVAFLRAYS